jgi:heat shock protein HslJ
LDISKLLLLSIVLLISTGSHLAGQTPSPSQSESLSADSRLANSQWRLTSLSASGAESPVIEGMVITLKFGGDGRAGGSSGCNSYGGEYRESGDSVSFSKLISTKRACLDQNANRQEQQYFAALESARTFKLTDNRLTIFNAEGQGTLNFVNDFAAKPNEQRYESRTSPVDLLASFYSAVNTRDYERAYRYWETPPGTLQDFTRGYVETESVQLIVQPPTRVEGAAGSLYAAVPTVIVARHRDGVERVFAGCYTMRKSNLQPSDVPKEEVWRIYRAKISASPADTTIPKLLAEACR